MRAKARPMRSAAGLCREDRRQHRTCRCRLLVHPGGTTIPLWETVNVAARLEACPGYGCASSSDRQRRRRSRSLCAVTRLDQGEGKGRAFRFFSSSPRSTASAAEMLYREQYQTGSNAIGRRFCRHKTSGVLAEDSDAGPPPAHLWWSWRGGAPGEGDTTASLGRRLSRHQSRRRPPPVAMPAMSRLKD
jgi:hypothetical protein